MIAHPPCTYLSSSGLHWNKRRPGRAVLTEQSLDFVRTLMDAPIPKIAVENPVGCISSRIRKPDQIIHPYQFGDDASKATCLWLKGLPHLTPVHDDNWAKPRHVCQKCERTYSPGDGDAYRDGTGAVLCVECTSPMKTRYANQTDSGQNRLAPSESRAADRARTYPGIAQAMAEQWG